MYQMRSCVYSTCNSICCIVILDKTGAAVVTYSYDPWGAMLAIGGSKKDTLGKLNPFRYRGYVYDDETGLYYLRSRYYKPEWCRFINSDTVLGEVGVVGSHNLFAYCGNNPVMMADPDGQIAVAISSGFEWLFAFFVGLLVEAGVKDTSRPSAKSTVKPLPWAIPHDIPVATLAPTVTPSPSPSPTPTPKPTIAPTATPNIGQDFYIVIAYEGGGLRPVSGALTGQQAYEILHTVNAAANVAKLVASSPYSNISKYVYGVYTHSADNARNLAKRFGDLNPRLDLSDGGKLGHYNVDVPGYTDIHFWFFC